MKCTHVQKKKHEDSSLSKNLHPLLKSNCTQDSMSINLPLPHMVERNLTMVQHILIAKPLKLGLHFLIHHHLVQRKRYRLGTVGENKPVKMKLVPIFWIQNPTREMWINRKVT